MNARCKILNRNQIKYILILAMLIDHIAWGFVKTRTPLGQCMHFIGRLTGPSMTFFLVEGYRHTSDLKKYLTRMGIFAVISVPAYAYFEKGVFSPLFFRAGQADPIKNVLHLYLARFDTTLFFYPKFGVIYTLFIALLALVLNDRADLPQNKREAGIVLLLLLSMLGDWGGFDVLFALIFYRFRDEPLIMWVTYCIVAAFTFSYSGVTIWALYQTGVFIIPFFMMLYNGERGSANPVHKWSFYVFYPLHLFILGYFRWH